MAVLSCPSCNQSVTVDPELLGKTVQCPWCSEEFIPKRPISPPPIPRKPKTKQTLARSRFWYVWGAPIAAIPLAIFLAVFYVINAADQSASRASGNTAQAASHTTPRAIRDKTTGSSARRNNSVPEPTAASASSKPLAIRDVVATWMKSHVADPDHQIIAWDNVRNGSDQTGPFQAVRVRYRFRTPAGGPAMTVDEFVLRDGKVTWRNPNVRCFLDDSDPVYQGQKAAVDLFSAFGEYDGTKK